MRYLVFLVSLMLLVGVTTAGVDNYNSSLKILLHGNYTNSSTYFEDSSDYHNVLTPTRAVIDSSIKFLGNGSIALNSTSLLTYPSTNVDIASNNFTLSMWIYSTNTSFEQIITRINPNSNTYAPIDVSKSSGNNLSISYSSTGTSWDNNADKDTLYKIPTGVWVQVVLIKNASTLATYTNGSLVKTWTGVNTTLVSGGQVSDIGGINSNTTRRFTGRIDEYALWMNSTYGNIPSIEDLYPVVSEIGLPLVPLAASFTDSPDPSKIGQSVMLNDTSTGELGGVTFSWSIPDEGFTNNSRNTTLQFANLGVHNILLNVTNSSGFWSNTSGTHTVLNTTVFEPQDIWMTGTYIQTFHVKDASTGGGIGNASISIEGGAMTTTEVNGTGWLQTDFGSATVQASANGYYSAIVVYVFDQDDTHTIELTQIVPESTIAPSIRYTPHLVRFIAKDFYGQPVSDITVTSTSVSSTASDNWILNILGLDMNTIPLTNSTLTGTSGTDGSVVFMMLETVQYQITFTNVAKGVSEVVTLYPKEDSYLVLVSTSAAGNADSNWGAGSGSIYRQLSSNQTGTKFFLNLSYVDAEHYTSSVFFYVEDGNRTPIYNTTYSGYSHNFSYMIDPFPHGATYYYGYTATNSAYGTLSGNAVATTHSRLLAPLEYLGWDTSWYMWITVVCLVCFAALFSGTTNIYGTLLLPIWSLMFGYFGWLDWCPWEFQVGVAVLGALVFISKMYARVSDG